MGIDHARGDDYSMCCACVYNNDGTMEVVGFRKVTCEKDVEDFALVMSREKIVASQGED